MTTSSAPGKIILFGEHAVVYGRPALAVPVTQVHADVEVTASRDNQIWIHAPDISLLHSRRASLRPSNCRGHPKRFLRPRHFPASPARNQNHIHNPRRFGTWLRRGSDSRTRARPFIFHLAKRSFIFRRSQFLRLRNRKTPPRRALGNRQYGCHLRQTRLLRQRSAD
jgi:hypothetical protein